MAGETIDAAQGGGSWRRGWASVGAVAATFLLILLLVMVTAANRARDDALEVERHTQKVVLLTRTVDATLSRAEAALGRFVLDERRASGTLYYNEWRLAGRQIATLLRVVTDPAQRDRLDELQTLYRQRGAQFATAAARAGQRKGSGGVNDFYQAGLSPVGPALRADLEAIEEHARRSLEARIADTASFDAQAQRFTEWLGWLSLVIGVVAIMLGLAAYRALTDELVARADADSETDRAMVLEEAVQARTGELSAANEALREEATERAAAEEKLRHVQKMDAVGQLTGGIAHDFNNMLAVIVGGLELARRKLRPSDDEVAAQLDHAMEGATRATALTRRLLAFARSEALSPEPLVPTAMVKGMLDLVDRALGDRITVHTRFPAEQWRVWADSSLLENAILNLCVNARDAMEGGGRITIAVDNVVLTDKEAGELAAGDYVRIGVADTGSGIAPEHLGRVFEPFFTTKPVGKGTGLGLSQTFGFARQSGGDVVIESAPGEGTSVSLYLPRVTQVTQAMALGAASVPRQRIDLSGTTILVVEDDARVSRATVASLEELGYRALPCATGAEALATLADHPEVALILSDVMMPEMTGPELIRIVMQRYPHLAVLFVTGFVGDADEGGDLSEHAVLRKPFTVAALDEAVSAILSDRFIGSRPAAGAEAAE